jgi:hypothetical protein
MDPHCMILLKTELYRKTSKGRRNNRGKEKPRGRTAEN